MAGGNLWSLVRSGRFQIREWDNEIVVYDSRAGDTHLLDPLASAVLSLLQSSPQTSGTLVRMLIQELESPPDDDLRALTEAALVRLGNLGLVVATPIEGR